MADKGFFSLKSQSFSFKNFKNNLKLTLSGISGAFVIPIGTLAVCSIFLAIGSLIEGITQNTTWINNIGRGVKALSYPVIKAIPLFFCVAFAISFTKNNPDAIWCALICYLVFIGVQNAFITENLNSTTSTCSNTCKSCIKPITGYKVFFTGAGRDPKNMLNIVDRTLGFTTLNTSIFGSMILGGVVVPQIIEKYSGVQLPKCIGFFSGKRFIPFVAALASAVLALLFLLVWPYIGTGISYLGRAIAKAPNGVDSLIFGIIEKSLIPFGLHHFFYSPFWYSSLGGDVVSGINEVICCGGEGKLCLGNGSSNGSCCGGSNNCCTTGSNGSCCKNPLLTSDIAHSAEAVLFSIFSGGYTPHTMWQGDSFIGMSTIGLPTNRISFTSNGGNNGNTTLPIFDFLQQKLHVNVGRFTNGKYPIMQFALPAVGAAMIYAAPKENRKIASQTLIPGILSSFILGITEPIEFSFLFLAPKLFYGFHAIGCGVSFMLMNWLGAHIPSIFSGGFLELLILGVIPLAKGTAFYNYFLVGAVLAPIYFWVFYGYIKYFDLKTPGRGESVVVEGEKSDLIKSKVPEKTRKLAIAFGGWDNLSKITNCASRLRYDIVDKSKVDEEGLKAAGVIAVKWVGDNHLQAIVGPQAESINNEMIKWKGEDLGIEVKDNKESDSPSPTSYTPIKKAVFNKEVEISEEEKEILWGVLENLGHKSNIVQHFINGDFIYIELKNMAFLNVENISAILNAPMYRIVNKNTFELFMGENIEVFYDKFNKFITEYKEIQD